MNKTEFSNSCVETLEILKYAPIEVRFKIPYRIKQKLRLYASKTYDWKYNENKGLLEQNCSDNTKELLSYLFYNYISKDYESKINKNNIEIKEYEEMFMHSENLEEKEQVKEIHKELTLIKEESFIRKVLNKIKGFFTRK